MINIFINAQIYISCATSHNDEKKIKVGFIVLS